MEPSGALVQALVQDPPGTAGRPNASPPGTAGSGKRPSTRPSLSDGPSEKYRPPGSVESWTFMPDGRVPSDDAVMLVIQQHEERLRALVDSQSWNHPETLEACVGYTRVLNTNAMKLLGRDQFPQCKQLLDQAKRLCEDPAHFSGDRALQPKWLAITLSNLGCYYKRMHKLWAALSCLHRVLRIEMSLPEVDNAAATHLNLCAVLSELKRHTHALQHANLAVQLLRANDNEGDRSLYPLALYNQATELEFLRVCACACASHAHVREHACACACVYGPCGMLLCLTVVCFAVCFVLQAVSCRRIL